MNALQTRAARRISIVHPQVSAWAEIGRITRISFHRVSPALRQTTRPSGPLFVEPHTEQYGKDYRVD